MKKVLVITLCSIFMLCGCTDPDAPSEDYDLGCEHGYSEGYFVGKEEGYKEGYNDASIDSQYEYSIEELEYWMYDSMHEYGIITFIDVLDNASEEERKQLISIASNIYELPGIYGEFVGDSETRLLHYTESECFHSIPENNIVLFNGSLDYIISKGIYTKCNICYNTN